MIVSFEVWPRLYFCHCPARAILRYFSPCFDKDCCISEMYMPHLNVTTDTNTRNPQIKQNDDNINMVRNVLYFAVM